MYNFSVIFRIFSAFLGFNYKFLVFLSNLILNFCNGKIFLEFLNNFWNFFRIFQIYLQLFLFLAIKTFPKKEIFDRPHKNSSKKGTFVVFMTIKTFPKKEFFSVFLV